MEKQDLINGVDKEIENLERILVRKRELKALLETLEAKQAV